MKKLFAVRDQAAGIYKFLHEATRRAQAMRDFVTACNNKESDLYKYPMDFMLFEIADYDESLGIITNASQPIPILSAQEALLINPDGVMSTEAKIEEAKRQLDEAN